jgi:hypothetical protein
MSVNIIAASLRCFVPSWGILQRPAYEPTRTEFVRQSSCANGFVDPSYLGPDFCRCVKFLTSHYVVGAIFVGAPMVPGGGLFDSLQPLLPCNLAVLIQSIGYRRGCSSLALLPLQHDFKSLGAIGGSGTQGIRASLSAP